jgi:hypothetical protein
LAKNQHAPKEIFLKTPTRNINHQKLGKILESKVVQNLSLEKNVFTKKWSPTNIDILK